MKQVENNYPKQQTLGQHPRENFRFCFNLMTTRLKRDVPGGAVLKRERESAPAGTQAFPKQS